MFIKYILFNFSIFLLNNILIEFVSISFYLIFKAYFSLEIYV